MAGMRLPNNTIPPHLNELVKVCNRSEISFMDSFGKMDENSGGDIVLEPGEYEYRLKYEAMHWFGDWTKEGKEWEREVTRVGKRVALVNIDNPIWQAIKEHKIYVEGCTQNKDYKTYSLAKFVDKHQKFRLDGPEDSLQYVRQSGQKGKLEATVPGIESSFAQLEAETPEVTPLKK